MLEKIEMESVLIEFETKVLPEEIFFEFREFVPKPVRCFNCQEFGHVAKMCKGKRRCARCGGEQEMGIVKREWNQSAVILEGITALLIGVVK